jgi:hypothetical protein
MGSIKNPALTEFVAEVGNELVMAQVRIARSGSGYELRHVADKAFSPDSLRPVKSQDARSLAQLSATGAFRPVKSAPNLQRGWRIETADDEELEAVLNQLYPGAIADWLAARQAPPPVTHFREFTGRQAGMYRITAMLNDAQAARVIRACCAERFCLKRRLWTVEALKPDAPAEKSLIQCLEPCAVFLEFARQARRIEQEGRVRVDLTPGEMAALRAAIERALAVAGTTPLEGDMSSLANPRRLQLVMDKLDEVSKLAPGARSE